SDPASLALAILRELRQPTDAVELRQRLASLGLVPQATRASARAKVPDPWPDLWRRIRPVLLAHEHVRVVGKRLAWSDTPIPKAAAARGRSGRTTRPREAATAPATPASAPLALLERLATVGADAEERQALRQEARDTLASPTDPYLAAAVVALGVAPSAPVSWATTPLPPPSAPAV